jgi:hypothetical protein
MTFFVPEVIGEPGSVPFFATPYHRFYGMAPDQAELFDFTETNLDEWDVFFAKAIPRAAWSELLYHAPLDRLDTLIFRLKGKPGALEGPGKDVFIDYPDHRKLIAALYYVGFAKRVEPYAIERAGASEWDQKKEPIDQGARDAAVAALAEGGRKALQAASDPFLRQRYAFQLLRLYFYHGENDRCASFYDAHRGRDFSDGSSVTWRALGYAAGAHYQAKRYAQANCFYSIMFDRYQPLRLAAAWSFHPQEESDWQESLRLAKSDREKAVLWQLLGIGADGLRAMREIYALDPHSDLLPLLLVREVTHAELAANLTGQAYAPEGGPGESKELLAFVAAVAEKGTVAKPWAWDLAAGHLHALAGELEAARRCLDRAEKRLPGNEAIQRQARLSRLFAELQAMKTADPAAEPMLAAELAWVKGETAGTWAPSRATAFFAWAKGRLSGLYREKDDLVTALCLQDATEEPLYADSTRVGRLMAFLEKSNKSAFEAFAAGEYGYGRADLVEVQGLNALYAGDVGEAMRLLDQVGGDTLPADPFEIHIRDNHDADAERAGHTKYTKAEAVRRLAGLLADAKADPARAPQLYFEVANAFYNITYFGNSRAMYETAGDHFVSLPRIEDTSRAESFYRKAMELSTDREFRAKAAFMAAKCELGAFYSSRKPAQAGTDFIAGQWFKTLRDDFSDTQYYLEVIHECGYFKTYVEKSASKNAPPKP